MECGGGRVETHTQISLEYFETFWLVHGNNYDNYYQYCFAFPIIDWNELSGICSTADNNNKWINILIENRKWPLVSDFKLWPISLERLLIKAFTWWAK